MAMRKHRAGELVVEQVRDSATVRALLETGGMITQGVEWPAACYLVAFFGAEPVGVVGVEPRLDAALIRSLYVVEPMRRRGVAAQLVEAARKAAHTRGARSLYLFAYPELAGFFARFGFTQVPVERLLGDLGGAPEAEFYRARPVELAREVALYLDISRDGVIER
jgi:GNAT superfamily N-acetyltransferase